MTDGWSVLIENKLQEIDAKHHEAQRLFEENRLTLEALHQSILHEGMEGSPIAAFAALHHPAPFGALIDAYRTLESELQKHPGELVVYHEDLEEQERRGGTSRLRSARNFYWLGVLQNESLQFSFSRAMGGELIFPTTKMHANSHELREVPLFLASPLFGKTGELLPGHSIIVGDKAICAWLEQREKENPGATATIQKMAGFLNHPFPIAA